MDRDGRDISAMTEGREHHKDLSRVLLFRDITKERGQDSLPSDSVMQAGLGHNGGDRLSAMFSMPKDKDISGHTEPASTQLPECERLVVKVLHC